MEIKSIQVKITALFQKYKYVVLILMVGIVLMLFPADILGGKQEKQITESVIKTQSIQTELENILSYIQGAGNVKVMLKELSGAETIYQANEDVSVSDTSTDKRINVITVTDQNRNEKGLIKQVNPPKYLGAVILCQGGDDPAVRLAITDAVSKITGLGADKIAVLKMK